MMYVLDPLLATLTITVIPLTYFLLSIIVKKTQKYFELNQRAIGNVNAFVEESVTNNEKVLSPGMKYRHYAPNTKCILIYSDDKDTLINELKKYDHVNNLIITNDNNIDLFDNAIGYGKNLDEISHNIFRILRKVDNYNKDLVIIEGVKTEGVGLAIMNRLIRACSYNFFSIKDTRR